MHCSIRLVPSPSTLSSPSFVFLFFHFFLSLFLVLVLVLFLPLPAPPPTAATRRRLTSERSGGAQRPIAHLCVLPLEDFSESNFDFSNFEALQTKQRRRTALFAWSLHHPPCHLPLLHLLPHSLPLHLPLALPFPCPRRLACFTFVSLDRHCELTGRPLYGQFIIIKMLPEIWEFELTRGLVVGIECGFERFRMEKYSDYTAFLLTRCTNL